MEEPLMDSSESSVDADINVTFSGNNPRQSGAEVQKPPKDSALPGFSSYFQSNDSSNASTVSFSKEDSWASGNNGNPIKLDNSELFLQEDQDTDNYAGSSTTNSLAESDQALIDFFLNRKTPGSKNQNGFDLSFIKSEPADYDDGMVEDETRKYQQTLDNFIVSEAEGIRVFRCMICDFISPLCSTVRKHMYTHLEDKRPFKCSQCDESFRKKTHLKKHEQMHEAQKPIQCSDCRCTFTDESALKEHIMVKHAGDRPYKCDLCTASYAKRSELKKHLAVTHREDRLYPCPYCDHRSKDPQKLRFHLASHSEKRPYLCEHCPKAFKRLGDLKVHTENIHEAKPIHKCKEDGCDFATSKILELRRHALIHSGVQLYPCPECHINFASESALRQHKRLHSKGKVHSCTLCDYGCLKLYSLKRHVRTHLVNCGERCPICNLTFQSEPDLVCHVLTHSNNLPYRCDLCPEAFLTPRELHAHKTTHKEDRPFICSVCDLTFKKEQELKRHILEHTEHRPFKCKECGKGFTLHHQLNLHLMVHSDDRPFSCSLCDYTCKRAADLRLHMKRHDHGYTVTCTLCPFTARRQRDLNRHMKTHTDADTSSSQAEGNSGGEPSLNGGNLTTGKAGASEDCKAKGGDLAVSVSTDVGKSNYFKALNKKLISEFKHVDDKEMKSDGNYSDLSEPEKNNDFKSEHGEKGLVAKVGNKRKIDYGEEGASTRIKDCARKRKRKGEPKKVENLHNDGDVDPSVM
ncbi:hypothetical protein EGW08_011814 [Elysia chlorotica]|uniref:C2H2-type domain-containing protein n=1 Tax=Elysia chlorotica TaxID=188477 RepID=A0A3S1C1L9_ELYCH|nr:hypothetical protein EGW08_011814 [Elysia chlorotica]